MEWASEYLTEWYGMPAVELDDEEKRVAASLLWMLKGDAMQRTVASWHMGWEPALSASGDHWQGPFLTQLLEDPYSQVRFIAYRSLRRLPAYGQLDYDFLAPNDELGRQKQAALTIWERAPTSGRSRLEQFSRVTGGEQVLDFINRLTAQRDDNPITIPE